MYLIIAVLLAVILTALVTTYYYRSEKTHLPGEDLDGDVRNTLIGMLFNFHLAPKTYRKHVMRNADVYFRFFLLICAMFVTIALIINLLK